MATYTTTKTIVSAKPAVRASDNIVMNWELEVEYTFAGDPDNSLPEWSSTYGHNAETEHLNKTLADFTRAELIGMMPEVYDNVFDDHYEHFNNINQPTADVITVDEEFDLNSLS